MVKNPPANAGDAGLIPGLGRSSGEENGNPLQYSCLENLMDRDWWVTVHEVTKSLTQLNTKYKLIEKYFNKFIQSINKDNNYINKS